MDPSANDGQSIPHKPKRTYNTRRRNNGLTEREAKLVKAVVANPSLPLDTIGLQSGYAGTPRVAAQSAYKAMQRTQVKTALETALAKCDLTDDRIAQELDKGLKQSGVEGRHIEYMRELVKLRGHARQDAEAGGFASLAVELSRGVVGPDGQALPSSAFVRIQASKSVGKQSTNQQLDSANES